MRYFTHVIPTLATFLTAAGAAACSSDAAGPSDPGNGGSSASAVVTVDSALGSGNVSRIDIELFPGELVAREVHVENDDAEEKIVSAATAIDPAQGTITLELGGLTVSYGAGTRFRTEVENNQLYSRAKSSALYANIGYGAAAAAGAAAIVLFLLEGAPPSAQASTAPASGVAPVAIAF